MDVDTAGERVDVGDSASEDEDETDELLEMASQVLQTGTAREKRQFMSVLRRGAGLVNSDVDEADDEGAVEGAETAEVSIPLAGLSVLCPR